MQFTTTLIALVAAGLANAQLPDIPNCSLNCFVTALTSDGCSSLTDFACHCQKPSLVHSVTPCVQESCDVADQISVSSVVVSQCSAAGHPISVPPVETSSSASETSASATTAESSSSSSASETTSSAPTATATPSSSAPCGSSSTGGRGSSTPAPTATRKPTKTSGGGTASASPTYNAAGNVKGNMAGVAAVAAAAAYILQYS